MLGPTRRSGGGRGCRQEVARTLVDASRLVCACHTMTKTSAHLSCAHRGRALERPMQMGLDGSGGDRPVRIRIVDKDTARAKTDRQQIARGTARLCTFLAGASAGSSLAGSSAVTARAIVVWVSPLLLLLSSCPQTPAVSSAAAPYLDAQLPRKQPQARHVQHARPHPPRAQPMSKRTPAEQALPPNAPSDSVPNPRAAGHAANLALQSAAIPATTRGGVRAVAGGR